MSVRRRAVAITGALRGRRSLRHSTDIFEDDDDTYNILHEEHPSATAKKTVVS